MKKLGRNTLALGMSTLLVTSAVALSANAAEGDLAQSTAIAAQADEGLFSVLNTGPECVASFNEGDDPIGEGEGEGRCGLGFNFSGIGLIGQDARADVENGNGVSAADASVAPIEIAGLGSIDLTELDDSLAGINTGTILDGVLGPLAGILELILGDLVDQVGGALNPVLQGIGGALPVSLRVGAVESFCEASPGTAVGNAEVANVDLVVELTEDQDIVLPLVAGTGPNTDLVSAAPAQLVDGIVDGLEAALRESLGGVLEPLAGGLAAVQEILDQVLPQVEDAILQPVSEALAPFVVSGTVNKQEPVSPSSTGAIEVTALDLTLLDQRLELAKVSCGPNRLAQVIDDEAVAGDDTQADDTDAQADGTIADAQADAQADAIADADAQADADVTTSLPNAGAPNLLPFWLLGLGLVAFGAAVLVNERRRALI